MHENRKPERRPGPAGRGPGRGVAEGGRSFLLAVASLALTVAPVRGAPPAPAGSPPPPVARAQDGVLAPRIEFLQHARRLFRTPGGQLDLTRSRALRHMLDSPPTDAPHPLILRHDLVQALLEEDQTDAALTEVELLFSLLGQHPAVLTSNPAFHRLRGLAYLRKAEVANCIVRHNRDCCVFPLAGGGVHDDKAPALEAAASYEAYLKAQPQDLGARWLLNLAHMALGTYPASVPEAYRLPVQGPGSATFPRFTNVAQACGITRRNHAGGVVADDVDGDGLLDIVVSSCHPDAPLALYRNNGRGSFDERGAAAGLGDQLGGLNLVSTDYDNDGKLDLFVLRGGWLAHEGRIRNSLLRNRGDGTFEDVTHAAGLAEPARPTQVGVWFDYDNDGDLDVFVGNESLKELLRSPQEHADSGDHPSNLFRNNGDGTFTDVATAAGVTNDRMCKGAAAGDYDNDGWTDLYVSNLGKNRLYRNLGNGTFEDVAAASGVQEPVGRSFATWFFDFDNDGHLDLFVGAYDLDSGAHAAWLLGREFSAAPPRLYRNRGDGTFEDITRQAGLWRPFQPMGAGFGDLDNDGWLDIYLTTGNPNYEALLPNVMLRNTGAGRFEDVTIAGGFGNLQKGHGVAFADFDQDGDADVFNQLGGFYRGDSFFNSLYENPGHAQRFVTLRLVGTTTNRLGYGARVRVVVRTSAGERSIHRAVGSVSSFGGSPARLEIGLGDAQELLRIEIFWPASGTQQVVEGVALDAFYEVTEGVPEAQRVAVQSFRLAAGS